MERIEINFVFRSVLIYMLCLFWKMYKEMLYKDIDIQSKKIVRRVWTYQRGKQNSYIEEEQTTQWPKEKVHLPSGVL